MKKLCFVFAAVMTAACIILLNACAAEPNEISERRSGYYVGRSDGYKVTLVSGERETPYAADGVARPLKAYTLITLEPDVFDIDAVYSYNCEFGGSMYGGALTVHPFGASYSAEFDKEVTGDEVTVTVTRGGNSTAVELKSLVSGDMLTYDRAMKAAKNEFKTDFPHETRVRLMTNPLGGDGLCWYVWFHGTDGGGCGVLLDPLTAKVLAKKSC